MGCGLNEVTRVSSDENAARRHDLVRVRVRVGVRLRVGVSVRVGVGVGFRPRRHDVEVELAVSVVLGAARRHAGGVRARVQRPQLLAQAEGEGGRLVDRVA